MESMVVGLIPIVLIDWRETVKYRDEFLACHENENVTWELANIGIHEYYERQRRDQRNQRFGFLMDGKLVGMARISSEINFEANGKIGYSIRPSERGKQYGTLLLRMIDAYCRKYGIRNVTACVDIRNEASIRALRAAGFIETGRVFDWVPNPEPRKAMEMALPHTLTP